MNHREIKETRYLIVIFGILFIFSFGFLMGEIMTQKNSYNEFTEITGDDTDISPSYNSGELKLLMDNLKKEINILHNNNNNKYNFVDLPPNITNNNEDSEIIECASGWIENITVIGETIEKFVQSNRFKNIIIICTSGEQHSITNRQLDIPKKSLSKFASSKTNPIVFTLNSKTNLMKNELRCDYKKKIYGLEFMLESHEMKPLCDIRSIHKVYDRISVIPNKKMSHIFAPYDGVYGMSYKNTCEKEKYVSNVNFIKNNDNKYINHIENICGDVKKFNIIEIHHGDYIDNVHYIFDDESINCKDCSKGGVVDHFKCPKDTYIIGHKEWIYENRLIGIQFICS